MPFNDIQRVTGRVIMDAQITKDYLSWNQKRRENWLKRHFEGLSEEDTKILVGMPEFNNLKTNKELSEARAEAFKHVQDEMEAKPELYPEAKIEGDTPVRLPWKPKRRFEGRPPDIR